MADYYNIILKFELALPFILLSLYLSIVVLGRKKQDKKSLQKLISLYKEKEDGRKQTVIDFLKNKAGLDEPASEATSKIILQARKSFIQKLISAFLTRKEESIANLDNELSMITRSYQELSISVTKEDDTEEDEGDSEEPKATEAPAKSDPKAADDLIRLKKENKNLKIEVHTTLSTLNNIFAEYTSMFGEESDRKDMSVDEILTAMESFGADQIEAASSTDASAEDLMAESEQKEEDIVAVAKPSSDVAEPKPEPKEEAKSEIKEEEPAVEEEPSWDEAFEEAKPEVKEEEPAVEEEPSWDEAFEEAEAEPKEALKEEAKPETKDEEPAVEEEPSWDEAFAETDGKDEPQDVVDKEEVSNETVDSSDDGWGDDNDDIDELDDEDMDDIQPEWGNAMEEELEDPDEEEKK